MMTTMNVDDEDDDEDDDRWAGDDDGLATMTTRAKIQG